MRPLLTYYGGKQSIADWIVAQMPAHTTYIEPFCGGAAVFFHKPPATLNVLNDKNRHLVDFYRAVQLQPVKLQRMIRATLHSRSDYQRACQIVKGKRPASTLVRAWAVYVTCNMSFAGIMMGGWGYTKTPGKATRACWTAVKHNINQQAELLKYAQIECRDAVEVIRLYDHADALIYADPPYVDSDQGHYKGYTAQDFHELLNAFTEIKGKFILSHYRHPIALEYAERHGWTVLEKHTKMAANNRSDQKVGPKERVEILVMNFTPAGQAPQLF